MGYKILKKVELCQKQYELSIDAPYITRNAKAGQFIILRVEENGERVPLTIADVDKENGILTIVYMAVGYTTKKLALLDVGDEIVDIRYFDRETQRSIEKLKSIDILPIYKFILPEKTPNDFPKELVDIRRQE